MIDTGEPGDQRSAQAREIVARQVRHLVRLVDDLLDVTRLATGKITLGRRPVDLAAVARRVVGALAATTPTLNLRSEAGAAVWIEADETRLEQILSNLLGNAVKFTPAGGRVASQRRGRARVGTPALTLADLPPRTRPVRERVTAHRRQGLGIGLTR